MKSGGAQRTSSESPFPFTEDESEAQKGGSVSHHYNLSFLLPKSIPTHSVSS